MKNKTITNVTDTGSRRLRGFYAMAMGCAFLAMGGQRASAATLTQLAGGDTIDGVDISSFTIAAGGIYAGPSTPGPLTWQGQSFTENAANATVNNIAFAGVGSFLAASSADTATTASFTNPGSPSTEDTNLLALVNAGLAFNGTTFTATASGLTIGNTYRVDLISSSLGYTGRDPEVSLNGDTATFTMDTAHAASNHLIWDWNDTAVAVDNGFGIGKIDMVFTKGTVAQGPLVNAILVSDIPEPSTYAMALGGFGMFLGLQRIRSRRSRFSV